VLDLTLLDRIHYCTATTSSMGVRVDAMLIEKIDRFDLEASLGSLLRVYLPDMMEPAATQTYGLGSAQRVKPNLVRNHHALPQGTPPPTNSSLTNGPYTCAVSEEMQFWLRRNRAVISPLWSPFRFSVARRLVRACDRGTSIVSLTSSFILPSSRRTTLADSL